jgi:glycosyltransferase involved in cell wall biosynthesis
MKILFVLHRYAPFPGGSEYNVQRTAEECIRRGYDVTVFAGEHKGDLNGVKVTTSVDPDAFDLIVVHGGDVGVQNLFLQNIKNFKTPVLYWLIKPSESPICLQALKDAKYIGCSTKEDWEHVTKWGVKDKSHEVSYGIEKSNAGTAGIFKKKYGIPDNVKMFLSCGGYWPNKRMRELATAFRSANLENAVLVTTGYDNRHDLMPIASHNVIPLMIEDPAEIKDAMADAHCYIMNSDAEGFGLVLLESMLNRTPWISRNIAGAKLMDMYGLTYDTEEDLAHILEIYESDATLQKSLRSRTKYGYDFVIENHLTRNTVNDIENIMKSNLI